jgi:YHS domain-containing protein
MKHTDPVCGMQVSEETPFKSHNGTETIYFCSAACKAKFDADPKQYETTTNQR